MAYDLFVTRATDDELRPRRGLAGLLPRRSAPPLTRAEFRAFLGRFEHRRDFGEDRAWLFDERRNPLALAEHAADRLHLRLNHAYTLFPIALRKAIAAGLACAESLGARLTDADGTAFDRATLASMDTGSEHPPFLTSQLAIFARVQRELTEELRAPLELPFEGQDVVDEYFQWTHVPHAPLPGFPDLVRGLSIGAHALQLRTSGDRATVKLGIVPVATLTLAGPERLTIRPVHGIATFREKTAAVLAVADALAGAVPGSADLCRVPVTPELRARIEPHLAGLGVEFWPVLRALQREAGVDR